MTKVLLYECAHISDLAVTLVIVAYLLYSTVNICIKQPLSPLIAIAILTAACLIAFCLINLKKWAALAHNGFVGALESVRNTFKSLCARSDAETDAISSKYEYVKALREANVEDDPNGGGLLSHSNSSNIPVERSSFSLDLYNPSRQFSATFHSDADYISFYSDYGRRIQREGSSADESSLIGKFTDRIEFLSYFDPDVKNRNKSRFVRLLCGFNFWFKNSWIKPWLHNAVFVVTGIIVTITWCIIWEWGAFYMEREEGNYNLLQWSVKAVPRVYWMFEGAFQLIFGFNYLIQLYDSEVRCRYILSLRGFIDLTMTPMLTQTITWVWPYINMNGGKYGSMKNFGLLFFGPLRFLKLTQAEELLNKSFDHLSDVHTIIIGIATAALSILFSFSGMMYLLEAPVKSVNFVTPFDFIYFGVATMGTVGYGDFTPRTFMGRMISIILICTCISLGAVHFKRLREAISKNNVNMGSHFDLDGQRHVLFWGPLSEYQILTFCRCLANSFDGVLDAVVVATPLPLESYRTVYRAVKRNTGINLYMIGGNDKICAPSYVYKLIGYSLLTVVVNDLETDTSRKHTINDDRMTILRAIASMNITKHLGIPIAVQLHGSEYASFLNGTSARRICFIRDLKYRLFAKSVECRGLFYFILTLFHTPTNIRRTRAYVEDLYSLFNNSIEFWNKGLDYSADVPKDEENPEHKEEYSIDATRQLFQIVTGMQFQMYKINFPQCTHGLKFSELCQYLYKTKNMFLIGIVSSDKCILNPVDYIVGSQVNGTLYQGLVLAMSLRDVLHISMLKNASLGFVPYKGDDHVAASPLKEFAPMPQSTHGIIYESKEIDVKLFKGIYKVQSYDEALHIFTEPRSTLILICGWVHDMDCFLKVLLEANNANVIWLAPQELVEGVTMNLEAFQNWVAFINGSAMEISDLSRAGVTLATCIIVLNSEQSSTESNCKQLPKDSQVLFVRHLIKQIVASSTNSTPYKSPHIILDIQHSACLEYLDPSLVSSMEASCGRDAMNRVWQNFGEFMTSYEMASGTIFVQDMLYGLLAHSYVPCAHSVGYDTIQQILHSQDGSHINNCIALEDLPVMFNGKPFKTFFKHGLFVEHKIYIGILRMYKDPVVKTELKQLVVVTPQPSFVLQAKDQVYVVKANMIS